MTDINITEHKAMLERATDTLTAFIPRLLGVLVFLAVMHIVITALNRFIKKILSRSKIDPTLHQFILGIIKISLWVITVISSLLILKVPTSPLVTILGSAGLAFSLALKDSLANVAGGISILLNRPFAKGDVIDIKTATGAIQTTGTVQTIDLVYTNIITEDGTLVYLPNGDVAKAVIINHKKASPEE